MTRSRAGFILFTTQGERVPSFSDERHTVANGVIKHGWKEARSWYPGFFVVRRGGHYSVGRVARSINNPIAGAVYQLRAWDWQPRPADLLPKRFPTIASVEMYLRHVNVQQ